MFLLLFIDKCILYIDVRASFFDMEYPMSIPQVTAGAFVAAALVFGGGAGKPVPAGPVAGLKLTADAYLADARIWRDVIVDVAFDAAGELAAQFKRI